MSVRKLLLPIVLAVLMVSASTLGHAMRPHIWLADLDHIDLEAAVPMAFGDWKALPDSGKAIIDPGIQRMLNETYTQTVTRTYVNGQGYAIMLSLAYGRDQRGVNMAHRPDVCYPAQGFTIQAQGNRPISTQFGPIPTERMLARNRERIEPVTFWFTEGDTALKSAFERRAVAMRYGVQGIIPDGMLFRVSSIDGNEQQAYQRHDAFVADLVGALDGKARLRLAGLH